MYSRLHSICRVCVTSVRVVHPVPRHSCSTPGCRGDGHCMPYFLLSTLSPEERKGTVLCVVCVCVLCVLCVVCVPV